MRQAVRQWKHIFKLDPERTLSDQELEQICCSGTDAIVVGGSSGVTYENTVDLLARIRRYETFCVLEVSDAEAVVPGFDLYLIPIVLNTEQSEWIVGRHQQAIKRLGHLLPWEAILPEGYVILNGHSTAARLTGANCELDNDEVIAYARLAAHLFHFPIFYMEYSGRFGDMELLQQVKQILPAHTQLIYGGGIDSLETAELAIQHADTVVVGNAIYDMFDQALETVLVKSNG